MERGGLLIVHDQIRLPRRDTSPETSRITDRRIKRVRPDNIPWTRGANRPRKRVAKQRKSPHRYDSDASAREMGGVLVFVLRLRLVRAEEPQRRLITKQLRTGMDLRGKMAHDSTTQQSPILGHRGN